MNGFTWQFFSSLLRHHVQGSLPSGLSSVEQARIDTAYLMQLLDEHRLELALYPLLKRAVPELKEVLNTLQSRCHALLQLNLQQQKVLLAMAKQLQEDNIPYVVLKGLLLNQQLYGDQCKRRSKDIDILVAKKDFNKANDSLIKQGFDSVSIQGTLTFEEFNQLPQRYQSLIKDLTYADASQRVYIELHYNSCLSGMDNILDGQIAPASVNLMGQSIKVLNPEDNFLYLCEHAAKHRWQRLQWLVDIAVLCRKSDLNWEYICKLAKARGRLRSVLAAKKLLAGWFKIALPVLPVTYLDQLAVMLHLKMARRLWSLTYLTFRPLRYRLHNRLSALSICLLFPSMPQKWNHLVACLFSDPKIIAGIKENPKVSLLSIITKSVYYKLVRWV